MDYSRRDRSTMKKLPGLLFFLMVFAGVFQIAAAQEVHTFQVKGIIKGLPGNGLSANEILVKHEPIPDYRDESGKVVGMMAMTMPFYLDKSANLQGIAIGDTVELIVEQQIKPTFSDKVVSIKKSAVSK
jgi:Cu/Ag efflux protein CusF